MDILDTLKNRRSCRSFSSKEVEEDKLNKIIEAGLYAPSGLGLQSPIFVVITNKEKMEELSKFNASIMGRVGTDPFYGSPCVIIVLANKDVPTHVYDGSLALGNMMNEAESLGVDSIWIHRAKEEFETKQGKEFLKSLGIQGNYEGIGHCCLGYSKTAHIEAKPRNKDRIFYLK